MGEVASWAIQPWKLDGVLLSVGPASGVVVILEVQEG